MPPMPKTTSRTSDCTSASPPLIVAMTHPQNGEPARMLGQHIGRRRGSGKPAPGAWPARGRAS